MAIHFGALGFAFGRPGGVGGVGASAGGGVPSNQTLTPALFADADTFYAPSVSAYDTDAQALFTAMTVAPDATRKGHINTLILALKAAGTWTKTDYMLMLAAHDAQAAGLNWKAPGTLTATLVNAPTFTVDRGYAGNGTSSYVETGWAPSTGVVCLQNDASFSLWCNTEGTSTVVQGGAAATAFAINARNGTNNLVTVINSASALVKSNAVAIGFLTGNRTSSTAVENFKNGASIGTGTATSAARTATTVAVCGVPASSQYSTKQMALVMAGGSRTGAEETNTYNAILAYMAAVGN